MGGVVRVFRSFLEAPGAVFGLAIVATAAMAALLAPLLAIQNPFDLATLSIVDAQLAPGAIGADGRVYWLGTDDQGRDVYSAILYGLRVSLSVAILSTGIACALGTTIGVIAGYRGGWLDALLMRLADIQLAFPSILVALVLLALLGPGLEKVIVAIVAVQWAYYARTARGSVLVERSKEYVLAACNLQFPAPRIMFFHLLPNSLAPLSVVVVVQMAAAIALEATLSFLGVGLPITEPSLGLLIANGYASMLSGEYWLSFYPGVVLLTVLLGMNLLGERLRAFNDPRVLA
jgi:peptide/nickel transport system permease protein